MIKYSNSGGQRRSRLKNFLGKIDDHASKIFYIIRLARYGNTREANQLRRTGVLRKFCDDLYIDYSGKNEY